MNKTIVFIDKIENIKEIFDKKNIKIIGLNKKVCEELKRKNIYYKNIDDYSKYIDFQKEAIEWMKEFPNQIISNDKNIKQQFTYKGVSLWWLAEHYLFSTSIFFESYSNILLKSEKIKTAVDQEKPKKIIYIGDKVDEAKIIDSVCKNKNLTQEKIFRKNKIKIKPYLMRKGIIKYKFFRNLLRKNYWHVISLLDNKKRSDKNKIFIFTGSQWGAVWDNKDCKKKIGDVRFYNIIKEIKNLKNISAVVADTPIGSELRIEYFRNRLNKFSKNCPIESYMTYKSVITSLIEKNKINKKYKQIKEKIKYIYKGIDLEELMKKKFDFFFSDYLFEVILFFKMINNALEKEKPKAVIISSETNPPQRILIALCGKKEIPTIALQHGASGYHIDYVMKEKDVSQKLKTAPFLPLPDYLCVYGKYYKKFFMEYTHYKANQIKIMGNPKYDSIKCIKNKATNKEIKKKIGIDKNKKVVLFFATSFNDPEYKEYYYNQIYDALKQMKDCCILVKLHPNEVNKEYHDKIIAKKNIKNIKLLKYGKLFAVFDLGICCDVMITTNSTTVLDIGMLNKPVIIFDPSKKDKYAKGFVDNGGGLGIYDKNKLVDVVNDILKEKDVKQRILNDQKIFIKKFTYSSDGKTGKRIANFIKKIIKI